MKAFLAIGAAVLMMGTAQAQTSDTTGGGTSGGTKVSFPS